MSDDFDVQVLHSTLPAWRRREPAAGGAVVQYLRDDRDAGDRGATLPNLATQAGGPGAAEALHLRSRFRHRSFAAGAWGDAL